MTDGDETFSGLCGPEVTLMTVQLYVMLYCAASGAVLLHKCGPDHLVDIPYGCEVSTSES